MFGNKSRRARKNSRDSIQQTTRQSPRSDDLVAQTSPAAVLPGGYEIRFMVGMQSEDRPMPVRFNWDPQLDPMSFVDVAVDQLMFALDFSKSPYEMSPQSNHEYVDSIGGIQWSPPIGRSLTDPSERVFETFGERVQILSSVYGALRQGLRLWSLHLSESAIFILSETSSEYRHKVRLSHIVDWKLKSGGEWSIIESLEDGEAAAVPDEERVLMQPSDESSGEQRAPLRFIGFFKLSNPTGWEEFTEQLVATQAQCVPSITRAFSEDGRAPFTGVFLSTRRGKLMIPKTAADFERINGTTESRDFAEWLQTTKDELPEWRAIK